MLCQYYYVRLAKTAFWFHPVYFAHLPLHIANPFPSGHYSVSALSEDVSERDDGEQESKIIFC